MYRETLRAVGYGTHFVVLSACLPAAATLSWFDCLVSALIDLSYHCRPATRRVTASAEFQIALATKGAATTLILPRQSNLCYLLHNEAEGGHSARGK